MTSSDRPADGSDITDEIKAASAAFSEGLDGHGSALVLWGQAVVGYRKALRLLGIDPDTGQLRGPYKWRM